MVPSEYALILVFSVFKFKVEIVSLFAPLPMPDEPQPPIIASKSPPVILTFKLVSALYFVACVSFNPTPDPIPAAPDFSSLLLVYPLIVPNAPPDISILHFSTPFPEPIPAA